MNTLTVLMVLSNLLICSTIVLETKRQVLNYYESLARIRTLEIKLYESEVNTAISFLHTIDKNIDGKQEISYNEISYILNETTTTTNAYKTDDYIIDIKAKASASDGDEAYTKRLNGLPVYQGTAFIIDISYSITNDIGEEYIGREQIISYYPVDFRRLLELIDNARETFEEGVVKHNPSSDELQSVLSNSINHVQESQSAIVTLSEIRVENNTAKVFYKVSLPITIQSFLGGTYMSKTMYQGYELTVNLRQE